MLRKLSVLVNRDDDIMESPNPKISVCSDKSGDSKANQSQAPLQRRRKNRMMSIESSLNEAITIYENMKKGRDNPSFRTSECLEHEHENDDSVKVDIDGISEAGETEPTIPVFNYSPVKDVDEVLDFHQFKNFSLLKYLYFSELTHLLQSDRIETLAPNVSELLKAKNYWLNIVDPGELDFSILRNSYGVHELTITDIIEPNTEEKLEVYKHYTFFSLRLMSDDLANTSTDMDLDFNILLFKDFVVTTHVKAWSNITDILGFINQVSGNAMTILTPDWVLLSCFIEMSHYAKTFMDMIEPEINKIRIGSKSIEMSDIMRRNFNMELQVYAISRFIKTKTRILKQIEIKCSKRLNSVVTRFLRDIQETFREETQDLRHYNHVLERSQDTFMAIVTSDQSREANEMNLVMKRISEFALIFLPIQAVAGFWGMNVYVPYQSDESQSPMYFWIIVGTCTLIGVFMYLLRRRILSSKNTQVEISEIAVPEKEPK